MNCIFCKIIHAQIPAEKIYEDDEIICIKDVNPQAKTHLLIMPKEHIESLEKVFPENENGNGQMIGKMYSIALRMAREKRLLPQGFRTVINTNEYGGQTVFHLHMHLLGGAPLRGNFG